MAGMELAQAYVQIIPSAQGIKGSISKVLGGEAAAAGTNAGETIGSKIKNVILKAGIGVAITKVISSAISEGAELEQSIGGIETLFKDSSDRMKEYANAAFETAGVSANTYMQQATSFSASLLQSLGGDTSKAAEAANQAIIDMSDNVNKMGSSMESVQNAYQGFAKQNYTMLDNLKLGYGGTKEEMKRLLEDAEKISGIEYNIDNLADVYSAIHIIQDELDITGTTSKEAATTLSGSFASMKAAASNFLGYLTLGEDIKPSLKAMIDTTCTFLFKNLVPAVGNVITALPGAIGEIAITGMQIGKDMINSISEGFSGNVTKFINNVFPMIKEFSATFRDNAGQLVDAGLNLIRQLAQGVADGIPTLIENIPDIVINIAGIINDNMPKILETGVSIILTISEGIINAIPSLIDNFPKIIESIFAVWSAVNWTDLGKNLVNGIKKGIKNLSETLKATMGAVLYGLRDKVFEIFNGIKEQTVNIWNDMITYISETVTNIKDFVVNLFNNIKEGVVSNLEKIKTSVYTIWNNIKTTLATIIGNIKSNVISIFDNIKLFISNVFNGIKNTASTIWNGIRSTITNVVNTVYSTVTSKFNSVKNTVISVFNGIRSTTTSIWNGIKSAITNPIETAKNTVKNLIDKMKGFFNFNWKLPSIKLPHFSVSGSANPLDWLKQGVPRISVEWYDKAMKNGMVLNGATIFGEKDGKLLGGGESGSETIVGTNSLMNMITNAVSSASQVNHDDTLEYIYQLLLEIYVAIKEGKTLSINGKRLACALAGDIDIELNKIRKNEGRR